MIIQDNSLTVMKTVKVTIVLNRLSRHFTNIMSHIDIDIGILGRKKRHFLFMKKEKKKEKKPYEQNKVKYPLANLFGESSKRICMPVYACLCVHLRVCILVCVRVHMCTCVNKESKLYERSSECNAFYLFPWKRHKILRSQ